MGFGDGLWLAGGRVTSLARGTARRSPAACLLTRGSARRKRRRVKSLAAWALRCVLLAWVVFGPGFARADAGDRATRLSHLADAAAHGGAPVGYVSLRQIWAEWDQGDPAEVEEVLVGLSESPRVAAPLRAYAELLSAYARRRRGDLAGARARIRHLGFVDRWIVAGPFDNEGKTGWNRVFGPEDEATAPLVLGRTYDGKERQVPNRMTPEAFPFGWIDFGSLMRPQENVCAYATTFVRSRDPKAKGPFAVWMGSGGAAKVFYDGQLVHADDKYRQLDADRFAIELPIDHAWHRLMVKVCGTESAPLLSLRLARVDGTPDDALEADPNPVHAREAAAHLSGARHGVKATVGGPIPAFERLTAHATPANAEAYARYLTLTRGDDPAEPRAQSLARLAAEQAPSIGRTLLAGELAENRNQAGLWVARAEALAARGASQDDQISVLLARAGLTRSGVHWRDAIPDYDRVLALDPDNVTATLARVELYAEAGLRETALATLTSALRRRPRSVGLLRVASATLQELGRTVEAEELTERYVGLRFDDATVFDERIDMALAKRDLANATRWADRSMEATPDSAHAFQASARAYMLMGERAKAVAVYRKGLDLAPEDIGTLRALSDLYGLAGQTEDQTRLLRKVLELKPQDNEVRAYLTHTQPTKARPDEAYARPSSEFLKSRGTPSGGLPQRSLVDLQVTTVFRNGLASRFHQVVFQPLTEEAAAAAREYAFSFEADTETVQLRGARIFRKDGTIDGAIESGEGPADNPTLSMYTSSRAFYVHFPRLSSGDVVELLYRVEDVAPRNAFADYFGEVVTMQSTVPIEHSQYVLITPSSRRFNFRASGVPGLKRTVVENAGETTFDFVAKNVPALESEPLQPPLSEALGHVHVSTYRTWEDVGRWYWGLVRDQFTADAEVRSRLADIVKGAKTEEERVRAVYAFVVQKTRYAALEFGIHGFKPYRCAQIFARGFGDCKDKATLLVTMLKELGIPATIVIVRSGQRGDFESDPASLAPFDHAIAYVPSLDLYLDGTAEFTGSRELPAMDRGALALQINDGAARLVHLPEPSAGESVTQRQLEVTPGPDGSASITWRLNVTGVSASSYRQRYHAEGTRHLRLQEALAGEWPGFEIDHDVASDLEDIERPVHLGAKGQAPAFARREGGVFTANVGARGSLVKRWASLSQRSTDLRLTARETQETDTLVHLPVGARVVEPPRSAEGTSAFGAYHVAAEVTATAVHVVTRIEINRSRISAKEYPAFRAFCESSDRAMNQTLVYTMGKP